MYGMTLCLFNGHPSPKGRGEYFSSSPLAGEVRWGANIMFAVRHSERSEESHSLNKEAEKLFSEHAPALLPLSSSNNISAPLFR